MMTTRSGAEGSIEAAHELAYFSNWDVLPERIVGVIERARGAVITDAIAETFTAIEHEDEPRAASEPLGRYEDARWRGFVGATFAADLACYSEPGDQVSFHRLADAMRAFPSGFRLWGARIGGAGSAWVPLGYSGVVPIAEAMFAQIEAGAVSLAGPAITALSDVEEGGSFLYLFNYSVVPQLRGTRMAARLLKALADDVARMPHRGLAALTVSPDGERVAARFGMTARARAAGAHESVFTCRTR